MRSPVIVVGVGRCGTSTVARLLHEELGVSMGTRFDRPMPSSPGGSWEDLDLRDLHVAFLAGRMSYPDFARNVREVVATRDAPWGFKDPRVCHLLGLYLQWIPSPALVWCRRDLACVTASIHRHYHTPRAEAARETGWRYAQLERALRGREPLELRFDELQEEGALVARLREFLTARSA